VIGPPRPRVGVDEHGRLVVPARRKGRLGQLAFSSTAAILSSHRFEMALPWSSFERSMIAYPLAPRDPPGWNFVPADARGPGLAVRVNSIDPETFVVLRRDTRRLLPSIERAILPNDVVPLQYCLVQPFALRRLDTLRALAELMRHEPDRRAALDDATTVRTLAEDLDLSSLARPTALTGLRRSMVEIHAAMQRCGIVHRYLRPVPWDRLLPLDEAVGRIRAALDASPYAHDLDFDDERIADTVRKDYLDVEPWPFAALDADPDRPVGTDG
jgi:hypothetical protein